ncbi:unnamed protein product [Caenorhabditis sp. 36 PRJEB53466]|nr:unnamed protein product [Caenorhabditis sp. 36 PRJEB53466]
MNFYSFFLLAVLAVFAMAAPQRVIEKTTIIRGGPSFGRPGPSFARPPSPPFRGPAFQPGPGPQTTIVKTTVIRGG